MRNTDASNAKSQNISHATALTSGIMNGMSMDTSSWTVLTEYLLQEYCFHTTRHTEIAILDLAQGTIRKIEKVETNPDHSLYKADIGALAMVTCTEVSPDYNNGTGTATIEAAQADPIPQTGDTVTGNTMICHTGHTTNNPHTVALQATTLRITVHHIHDLPTKFQNTVHTKRDHAVQDHTPTKETKGLIVGGVRRSR